MRPFRLEKKLWEMVIETKRLNKLSYEVETQVATFRRNRADLKEQRMLCRVAL